MEERSASQIDGRAQAKPFGKRRCKHRPDMLIEKRDNGSVGRHRMVRHADRDLVGAPRKLDRDI